MKRGHHRSRKSKIVRSVNNDVIFTHLLRSSKFTFKIFSTFYINDTYFRLVERNLYDVKSKMYPLKSHCTKPLILIIKPLERSNTIYTSIEWRTNETFLATITRLIRAKSID